MNNKDKGMTIIEVMFAFVILFIGVTLILQSYRAYYTFREYRQDRQQMLFYAAGQLEALVEGEEVSYNQNPFDDYTVEIYSDSVPNHNYLEIVEVEVSKDGSDANQSPVSLYSYRVKTADDGDDDGNGGEAPGCAEWSPQPYEEDDCVVYNGRTFVARYYAQADDIPGELDAPWQEITDQWRNFNVYEEGDIVIYEGREFEARYWTQNDQPGLLDSPWQELTDQWRSFNIYNSGDVVWYNGQQYEAKKYTQNEPPASSNNAWKSI